MDKKELRRQIRALKGQFSKAELSAQSACIIKRLLANRKVVEAHTILMYYSLPDEVDTHKAVLTLLQEGKTVLLPRVVDDENMEIRMFRGELDLSEGSFGIMEPNGEVFQDYDRIDVAVIPGMAFDDRGNRLGRGKGYYDRFLSKVPDLYKIGVCFDFQKLPGIPVGEHDMKMDCVI